MTVYHGSNLEVFHPDVFHSERNLDFGKGFYVTGNSIQAERWAKRKAFWGNRKTAIVNSYECIDVEGLRILDFGIDATEWIDFVCDCRSGGVGYLEYDIIKGMVANDKVFRVVDMYKRGDWTKERAIQEMRAYENYDQMAFITQDAIDRALKFKGSYEVRL